MTKENIKKKKQDIKDLEAEVAVLREELAKKDDYHDTALRIQAEFDNFRKRSAREKMEFVKYANESLILELVGILDNFERSIKAADQKQDFKLLHQGVDMISKQLHKLLEEKGLKKIKCAGEKFDPNKHEAIEVVESDEAKEGDIIEELQAGYMLNERVIRPAMVKVVKGKDIPVREEEEQAPAEEEAPRQEDIEDTEEESGQDEIDIDDKEDL